ncbi:hypothetical protein EYR41_011777 [Orbilia oligospora]|uniref:Uncharacterized protein n=2 Tax=Orbilia oligospora TaxID=2813651 RepID=A0A7C8PP44_ORBOL|nr:hypothetical protein TWF751_003069 [Orbilia oligospora]TGJ62588.1 hypothetical protein EYR41_011777 [Orbilia oligospora]
MSNISSNSAHFPDEVDIIVAGGGSAGCTLAGRLAAADPSLSILVIEAGINNKDVPNVVHPAMYLSHLIPGAQTTTFHKSKKSEKLNNREAIVPIGGCLGGSSSINFMMYTRGQGIDYDDWKTEGWSGKDLLPLFKKIETFHNDHPGIDKSVHGYEGPFHVSHGGYASKGFQDDCIRAAAETGLKEVPDANNLTEANGIQRWLKWIHPTTGRRQDAAHALLHPILESNRTGLQVLTEHKVVKVIISNGRATGVECIPNICVQTITPATEALANPKIIKARKYVVVSAGSLSTPCILERSGIGSKSVLGKAGIPVVAEVPGVGTNYMDHNLYLMAYNSTLKEEESFDPFLDGRRSFDAEIDAFSKPGCSNQIAWSAMDVAAKVRPSEAEIASAPESFKKLWRRDYESRPERPLMVAVFGPIHFGDHSVLPVSQYMTSAIFLSYPYGRGYIHVTGPNVDDERDFDSGILSDDWDLDALVIGYKRQREIVRRMKSFVGGAENVILGPKFREGSKGSKWDYPTANGAVTQYDAEDDEAIKNFIRDTVATTWHSCGTCAMKPLKDGGVVDGKLNVYGIEGLKVADLSIMPSNISGNTYATALLVGEKAATILAEELGIQNF